MSEPRWEIVGGPEPYDRGRGRDETAWVWTIARSHAERGTVVFVLSAAAVELAELTPASEAPIQVADAHRTRGRSVIEPLTGEARPPHTLIMDSDGNITTE